jgi:quercetin dioxygenase-like cupin family protein
MRSIIGLFACALALTAQTYPPPFPREAARLLFENNRVAVWDVTWPKGQPTAVHVHPVDQLSVTLVKGTVRVTRLGGTPTVGGAEPGGVVFTPQGTVHMEEGLSEIPQRKIMLQLKPSATQSGDKAGSYPGAVKLLENSRVVAWDYTWKPGNKTPGEGGNRDSVIVFLDGNVVYSPRNAPPHIDDAIKEPRRSVIVELK